MLSRLSLKYRVLALGALCALLAALSGVAGILSLHQIHDDMSSTTEHVGAALAAQNGQVHRLIALRSLVSDIIAATSRPQLREVLQGALDATWAFHDARGAKTAVLLSDLFRLKDEALAAQSVLCDLACGSDETLAEVRTLASTMADGAESDSIRKIAALERAVHESVEKLTGTVAGDLALVEAAQGLRVSYQEIKRVLGRALASHEPAALDQAESEVNALLQRARGSVAALQGDEMGGAIRGLLDELAAASAELLAAARRAADEDALPPAAGRETRVAMLVAEIDRLTDENLQGAENETSAALNEATTRIRESMQAMSAVTGRSFHASSAARRLRSGCSDLSALVNKSLLSTSPEVVSVSRDEAIRLLESTQAVASTLEEGDTARAITATLRQQHGLLQQLYAAKHADLLAQERLRDECAAVTRNMRAVDEAMAVGSRATHAEAGRALRASADLVGRWRNIELTLLALSLALAIGACAAVSASVAGQLKRLSEGVKVVGAGDLEFRVDTGTRDEIGQLSRAFDEMAENLDKRSRSLVENERRFRGLFQQSNDGIVVFDRNLRMLDANDQMTRMLGRDRQDLLGGPVKAIAAPGEEDALEAALRSLDQTRSASFETVLLSAGGRALDVEVSASVFDAENGMAQAVVRDITDRKSADLEMKARLQEISEGKRRLELLVSKTAEREMRMVLLKDEVNELLSAAGRSPKYAAPERIREAGLEGVLARQVPMEG
ncbi:MAG: PAS domain S-box protein [Planctomycetes bacterium]|nr:PAS domain S-box protein [Planctomycetota bacterium]